MAYARPRWALIAVCLAAVALMAVAGCGDDSDDSGDSAASGGDSGALAQAKENGTVKVAISNELPYAKLEPGGKATGADPDIARAAMQQEGVKDIEGIVTDYDAMIPGLQADQWDMVAAGLQVYEDRCKQVLFSEPTIADEQVAVVKSGNPKSITSYKSIADDPSIKFAVIRGTTYDTEGQENGVKEDQMVGVPDTKSGVAAVSAGRADVHTLLARAAASLEEQGAMDGLEVTPVEGTKPQVSAVAFNKDDADLRDAFNAGLAKIKEDGTFDELSKKWGFDPEVAKGVALKDIGPSCG
jgi:polar amino acid transport system substrate-binding protein